MVSLIDDVIVAARHLAPAQRRRQLYVTPRAVTNRAAPCCRGSTQDKKKQEPCRAGAESACCTACHAPFHSLQPLQIAFPCPLSLLLPSWQVAHAMPGLHCSAPSSQCHRTQLDATRVELPDSAALVSNRMAAGAPIEFSSLFIRVGHHHGVLN